MLNLPMMVQAGHRRPLQPSNALDKFKYEDTTPEIGREFLGVDIVDDLLNAPNADDVLRDLAITSKSMLLRLRLPLSGASQTGFLTSDGNQYLGEASSSFEPRKISPTSCRRNLCIG